MFTITGKRAAGNNNCRFKRACVFLDIYNQVASVVGQATVFMEVVNLVNHFYRQMAPCRLFGGPDGITNPLKPYVYYLLFSRTR